MLQWGSIRRFPDARLLLLLAAGENSSEVFLYADVSPKQKMSLEFFILSTFCQFWKI
jgi:hypothetical protein